MGRKRLLRKSPLGLPSSPTFSPIEKLTPFHAEKPTLIRTCLYSPENCCNVFQIIFIVCLNFIFVYGYHNLALQLETEISPPGQMVRLSDGHSMFVRCLGTRQPGKPTVVITGGLSTAEVMLLPQQLEISNLTYTCTYDRSGLGWSEPSPKIPSAEVVAGELHEVLVKTGVADGPMILVGSSLGAIVIAQYSHLYPQNIVAIILDDPPYLLTPHGAIMNSFRRLATLFYYVSYLAEWGFLRPLWYFHLAYPIDARVFSTAPGGGQPFNTVNVDLTPYGNILSGKSNGHLSGMYKETIHAISHATEGSNTTQLYHKLCHNFYNISIVHFMLHPLFGKYGVFDWYNLDEVNYEWKESRIQLKNLLETFSVRESNNCRFDYIEDSIHLWMWTNLHDFVGLVKKVVNQVN